MAQSGLLEWANSLRLTMATDPGRQLFQEQVHTHGFLFLDDYLDNILSGAKQDPLIELVKTPSRKKAIAMKPKLSSKLASVVTLSLEDDFIKQSSAPVSTFHKALLNACQPSDGVHITNPDEVHPENVGKGESSSEIGQNTDPFMPPSKLDGALVGTSYSSHSAELTLPSSIEQKELSIIAEDDENGERTRMSIQIPRTSPPKASVIDDSDPHTISVTDSQGTMGSSAGTFHSIPLSPAASVGKETSGDMDYEELSLPRRRSSLIQAQAASEPKIMDNFVVTNTERTPSEILEDIDIPIRDPDSESDLTRKSTVPVFPSLPEPIPLRKSMKLLRDQSGSTTSLLGTTTPGATLTGKRTSWLMKAREAKALEGINKKSSSSGHFANAISQTPGIGSQASLKRKSGEISGIPGTNLEDDERKYKAPKTADVDLIPSNSKPSELEQVLGGESAGHLGGLSTPTSDTEVLDLLKKTVEDITRHGKATGKSLGSNAVNALAEARAAAEARIAERHQKEEMTLGMGAPVVPQASNAHSTTSSAPSDRHERLSISDLFPTDSKMKEKHKSPEKSKTQTQTRASGGRESTSTTPPNSPPQLPSSSFVLPSGPVFNKPPPVFVPPVIPQKSERLGSTKGPTSTFASSTPFTKPVSMAMGISPRLPSPKDTVPPIPAPLTAHSTLDSMKSEKIFDTSSDAPAWMPSTQDTEYTNAGSSQGLESNSAHMNEIDEDDSWPIDDKIVAGAHWTFGTAMNKDDSLTWSSLPSQSQRGDTGILTKEYNRSSPQHAGDMDIIGTFQGEDMDHGIDDQELEDAIIGADKSTVKLVEAQPGRSASVMSTTSSGSSQSQGGFFNQASKLLSSALGTSKKAKPEVKKVLQMAAVAAKKQQEEADKKAARLKEMENRRLMAQQRKAEEEKARASEQERKLKEEGERRKRERDETDKRPLKTTLAKKDEDTTKKRKIEAEKKPEVKKSEIKKPEAKKLVPTPNAKVMTSKPSQKPPSALASSAVYNSSAQVDSSTINSKSLEPTKLPKIAPSSTQKGKAKLESNKQALAEEDVSQPSQVLQTQMAARAKAQIEAAKHTGQIVIPSESIELPDINSEYSDSEDEDRPRTFDPPDWAQSPELRQALQTQSTINPDDVFGAVRPLRMEEIFKSRTSRFRARTSSANWTGTDRLTLEEEKEYARRMGFR